MFATVRLKEIKIADNNVIDKHRFSWYHEVLEFSIDILAFTKFGLERRWKKSYKKGQNVSADVEIVSSVSLVWEIVYRYSQDWAEFTFLLRCSEESLKWNIRSKNGLFGMVWLYDMQHNNIVVMSSLRP